MQTFVRYFAIVIDTSININLFVTCFFYQAASQCVLYGVLNIGQCRFPLGGSLRAVMAHKNMDINKCVNNVSEYKIAFKLNK